MKVNNITSFRKKLIGESCLFSLVQLTVNKNSFKNYTNELLEGQLAWPTLDCHFFFL